MTALHLRSFRLVALFFQVLASTASSLRATRWKISPSWKPVWEHSPFFPEATPLRQLRRLLEQANAALHAPTISAKIRPIKHSKQRQQSPVLLPSSPRVCRPSAGDDGPRLSLRRRRYRSEFEAALDQPGNRLIAKYENVSSSAARRQYSGRTAANLESCRLSDRLLMTPWYHHARRHPEPPTRYRSTQTYEGSKNCVNFYACRRRPRPLSDVLMNFVSVWIASDRWSMRTIYTAISTRNVMLVELKYSRTLPRLRELRALRLPRYPRYLLAHPDVRRFLP